MDTIDECKKYNKLLWKCIEDNNNTVKNCGKYYYLFNKCFNSIHY